MRTSTPIFPGPFWSWPASSSSTLFSARLVIFWMVSINRSGGSVPLPSMPASCGRLQGVFHDDAEDLLQRIDCDTV